MAVPRPRKETRTSGWGGKSSVVPGPLQESCFLELCGHWDKTWTYIQKLQSPNSPASWHITWGLCQNYIFRDISLEWKLCELPEQECWTKIGFLSYVFGSMVNVMEAFNEFPLIDFSLEEVHRKNIGDVGKRWSTGGKHNVYIHQRLSLLFQG